MEDGIVFIGVKNLATMCIKAILFCDLIFYIKFTAEPVERKIREIGWNKKNKPIDRKLVFQRVLNFIMQNSDGN